MTSDEALSGLAELLTDDFMEQLEREACEASLYQFVKQAWPIIEPGTVFVDNWHIRTICAYLEAFHYNRLPDKRLIINVSPAAAKSLIVSVMYPAWAWCTEPTERFLTVSNEQGLATRDARRMKQIVTSDWYQRKWPTTLANDQNEKTLFANDSHGSRQAIGITASVSGKRCSVLVIDDPVDTKHAFSDVINKSAIDTFDQALSTRLNDLEKSGILLIMQRTRHDDLTGHLLKKVKSNWTHLNIPMRYEGRPTYDAGKDLNKPQFDDPRTKKGELMFPQRFSEKSVQALEEDLGEHGKASQLQQRPSPIGGGIIKKHWWRVWPDDQPKPICNHIFHSWDTAFSEKDMVKAAYSACTRWGIFWHEQREMYCMLALGLWFERLGYDELRGQMKLYDKEFDPDINLIERKSTGISLIQDMRRASPGRVRAYTPGRGEDKVSRAHSVSPMFQSGQIYVPNRDWALGNEAKGIVGLVDYVAEFPTGTIQSFDITDTVTQACIYLRAANWVSDHPDDKEEPYDNTDRRTDEQREDQGNTRRTAAYG
jgi:phage terminase large subunit-like protein